MPLKDRDRTRPRRLVRLGVIRLGHKEQKKKKRRDGSEYIVEYPVQDDHFVLTDAPEIAEVYGETPRELDVMLPFPDVYRNFDAAYTVWAGGVLVCRGDGEFVDYAAPHEVRYDNNQRARVYNGTGDTLVVGGQAQVDFEWNGHGFKAGDTVPCPGEKADMYPHCAACRVSAILKVMMSRPELFRLGYYQIATGSGRNYDTILGTMELIYSYAGHLSGIPFKLRLVKEPTTYLDNGKRHSTEKWFLQLESDPEYTRRLYRQQANSVLEPIAQLPSGNERKDAEFEEWDEPEPPPHADNNPIVDAETGEFLDDESAADDDANETGMMTLEQAGNFKTPKGARYLDLNVDQLLQIMEAQSTTTDMKTAALLVREALLSQMEAENEDGAGQSSDPVAEAAVELGGEVV